MYTKNLIIYYVLKFTVCLKSLVTILFLKLFILLSRLFWYKNKKLFKFVFIFFFSCSLMSNPKSYAQPTLVSGKCLLSMQVINNYTQQKLEVIIKLRTEIRNNSCGIIMNYFKIQSE